MSNLYEFSDIEIKSYASNVLIKVLIGIMKKDLTDVKHFLRPELYDEINQEIKDMKSKNMTQIYEEPNVYDCNILNRFEKDDKYVVNLKIIMKIVDYIVDEKGSLITGNDKVKIEKPYYLKFELNKNHESYEATMKCPTCSASVNVNMSGKCEHCGSIFPLEKYDWILKEIR